MGGPGSRLPARCSRRRRATPSGGRFPEMIRFAHPEFLFLLLLVPILAGVAVVAATLRLRALRRFGNPAILERLAEGISPVKRRARAILVGAAVLFLVLALANPQIGTRLEEMKQEGVDLFIALDVSYS